MKNHLPSYITSITTPYDKGEIYVLHKSELFCVEGSNKTIRVPANTHMIYLGTIVHFIDSSYHMDMRWLIGDKIVYNGYPFKNNKEDFEKAKLLIKTFYGDLITKP